MDENWSADIDGEQTATGRFVPVLILRAPAEFGEPVRVPLDGDYASAELAMISGVDAVTAMALPLRQS